MKTDHRAKTIFSVGGGKGGVGKSIFSVALGTALARKGHKVILVDLDLGAANLHTYLGIVIKTPTIADFILKKISTLNGILLETSQKNLFLISGAEFVPGIANPAHWTKMKIMNHIKALPADFIIADLGAGVHFNTLDFFGMSDRGIVVTAPEPGAVMNAYGFIKGALFRKLQKVFRKDSQIGKLIDSETKKTEKGDFTLEQLIEHIKAYSPDMIPLVHEIEMDFCPALIINRVPEGRSHLLVKNLISLCTQKLGISIDHTGNLPDVPDITYYLLNIPGFLDSEQGSSYFRAVETIADRLCTKPVAVTEEVQTAQHFTDEEIEDIIKFMEGLDDSIFSGTDRNRWKLRMYFKPAEVVRFLASRGVKHKSFF